MNNIKEENHLKRLNRILKNNIMYLVLPIVYLLLSLFMAPRQVIYENTVSYNRSDSYRVLKLTNADKVDIILDKYNLSKQEFNILVAIVLSEAENSYEDSYAVINTIYNRTHAKNWVNSVNSRFGNGKGNSLYYQAISPNQFVVYQSGSYKRHLGVNQGERYQAIIDFLYTEKIMHNYLSFRAPFIKVDGSETFSQNGNNYFNILKEDNRI